MSKLLQVYLIYDDHIAELSGAEAEKWNEHNIAVARLAQLHGCNPFLNDPVNWHKVAVPGSTVESFKTTQTPLSREK